MIPSAQRYLRRIQRKGFAIRGKVFDSTIDSPKPAQSGSFPTTWRLESVICRRTTLDKQPDWTIRLSLDAQYCPRRTKVVFNGPQGCGMFWKIRQPSLNDFERSDTIKPPERLEPRPSKQLPASSRLHIPMVIYPLARIVRQT